MSTAVVSIILVADELLISASSGDGPREMLEVRSYRPLP